MRPSRLRKTYSLGVILEHLLTDTDLRVLILDPNSDFVRMNEVREGSEGPATDSYRSIVDGSRSAGPLPDIHPCASGWLS